MSTDGDNLSPKPCKVSKKRTPLEIRSAPKVIDHSESSKDAQLQMNEKHTMRLKQKYELNSFLSVMKKQWMSVVSEGLLVCIRHEDMFEPHLAGKRLRLQNHRFWSRGVLSNYIPQYSASLRNWLNMHF